MVSATIYFSWTIYRDHLLANYGLPGAALQESLQATMATGYLAILAAFLWMIPGFLGGFLAGGLSAVTGAGAITGLAKETWYGRLIRLSAVIVSICCFLGSGWYAGNKAAAYEYGRVQQQIRSGCQQCFLYNTVRGRVVALPVGQDANVIILATRSGAVVLPATGIRAIRPINPRPISPIWKSILL